MIDIYILSNVLCLLSTDVPEVHLVMPVDLLVDVDDIPEIHMAEYAVVINVFPLSSGGSIKTYYTRTIYQDIATR